MVKRRSLALWAVFLAILLSSDGTPARPDDVWLLVDTQALTLTVMRGQQTVARYENIALGRNGTARDKRRGDDRTPLGQFRVAEIPTDSRFHRFFVIDYPNLEHAERGLRQDIIGRSTYSKIRRALRAKQLPPQNTALGGRIGIHGVGEGDMRIHEAFNWTHGCVALSNDQVDELAQWVTLGTRVVIR